jgi:uncharacterized protein YbjT (DUF2867 family)
MTNTNYALFGATGAVGKALAAKLAKGGRRFRVVGRSEDRLRHDFGIYEPLVEYCAADLGDSGAAARAAAGIDTIFYTVGVPYPQFEQHPKLTRVALGGRGGSWRAPLRPPKHRVSIWSTSGGVRQRISPA